MVSSLKSVFVEAVLRCWLAMAFSSSSYVCAVQTVVPKPRRISSNAYPYYGGEGTAVIEYFCDIIGLRSHDVEAIAAAIVRQGRLTFTQSSDPLERRVFLQRFVSMYQFDNYLGSVVVAK